MIAWVDEAAVEAGMAELLPDAQARVAPELKRSEEVATSTKLQTTPVRVRQLGHPQFFRSRTRPGEASGTLAFRVEPEPSAHSLPALRWAIIPIGLGVGLLLVGVMSRLSAQPPGRAGRLVSMLLFLVAVTIEPLGSLGLVASFGMGRWLARS